MAAPVTGFYAAFLALLILLLALRVVVLRWRTRTGIGDGGDRGLARAIRAHGNAIEYVPVALVLMLVAELGHASPALLHSCGIALCAARVLHAAGLSRRSGATPERVAGTVGTFTVIAVLAGVDLAAFLR
jgi:uncharacterized membrane protein YecN with MAPEG domain